MPVKTHAADATNISGGTVTAAGGCASTVVDRSTGARGLSNPSTHLRAGRSEGRRRDRR